MRKVLALSLFAIVGMIMPAAAQDAVAARQAMMKDMGGASRTLTQMARGQAPYDAAAAVAAFTKIHDDAGKMLPLFAEPPAAGVKTGAAPKIWEDKAGFEAAVRKLEADSAAAIKVAGNGAEALGPALQAVGGNCGACHQVYRLKQ